MYPSFTVLLVALAGMTFLVAHKMYEQKKGRSIVSPDLLEKTDAVIVANLHERLSLYRKKTLYYIGHSFLVTRKTIQYLSILALHRVQAWTGRTLDRLKGKGDKRASKGSVSFFLKHMAEYKEELQGRR